VWKTVETKARKVRVAEAEGRRKKKEERKKQEEKKQKGKEKKRPKKGKIIEVKKVAEKYKIWDEEEETAKSEEKAKKLVLERFHKWIHVFDKKASKRMPTRKLWDHAIDTKEGFVLRKGKVYPLSREKREEVCKFILEQLRKEYIRPLKLSQVALMFFVGKKRMVRREWYRTIDI